VACRDIGERDAFGGKFAVAVVEGGHCLPAPDVPGAVGGSAGGWADGVDDGGGVVSGAPGAAGGAAGVAVGLDGGSFSGPLMPQDVSASAAMHAMPVATQRRNIPGSRCNRRDPDAALIA
jgi:hypothetical protein